MERRMFSVRCGLCLGTFFVATGAFALQYDVDLGFFRKDTDATRYYGTVEKVEWNGDRGMVAYASRRTFDICYDIRPSLEPIVGPKELVLESESSDAETVELSIKEFPDGKLMKFRESWTPRIVFKTALDPEKHYQIRTLRVTCKQRHSSTQGLRKIELRALSAAYDTVEAKALRVEVETGNPFHCVCDEMGEVPKLRIENLSKSAINVGGKLSLESSIGEKIDFPVGSVAVEGGKVALLPIPETKSKGVWRASGSLVASDGSTNIVETRFARIDCHKRTPAIPRGTFRMGINYHMASYSDLDQEKTLAAFVASGAKLARAGIGLAMKNVQKDGPDEWRWDSAEKILAKLDSAGIRTSTAIGTMPKWAVRPDAIEKAKKTKNWRWEVLTLPRDNLYERYCEKLAEHFKGRLDYYEIGNEWDLNFYHPVSEAVEIQRQAYRGLKRSDPEVCVLPNGWAGANDLRATRNTPRANIQKEFLLESKGDCYDVHPTHCHGDFASFERRMESFSKLRKDTGCEHRPIFINESAFSSWRGERESATIVWKKIVFSRALGSVDYIWYNLRGTSWNPKDPEQGYGMLTAGYLPRETFVSFAALATLLKGQNFIRTVQRQGKRHIYEFGDGKTRTLIGWDAAFKASVTAVCVKTDAAQAEYVDLFGNRRRVTVKGGALEFEINDTPCAVVLHGATFAHLDEGVELAGSQAGLISIADIPKAGEGKKPQFVLSSSVQVTDFFEAIPWKENRLWKGPDDLSAEVWLERDEKALTVRISVRDDRHVPRNAASAESGDAVMAEVLAGARCRLDFGAPKCVKDGMAHYEARISWKELGVTSAERLNIAVLVEDDDGLGRECSMEIEKGSWPGNR